MHITIDDFVSIGIIFPDADIADLFEQCVDNMVMISLGASIESCLTDKQVELFDSILDDDNDAIDELIGLYPPVELKRVQERLPERSDLAVNMFLNMYCPDYHERIDDTFSRYRKAMSRNATGISKTLIKISAAAPDNRKTMIERLLNLSLYLAEVD